MADRTSTSDGVLTATSPSTAPEELRRLEAEVERHRRLYEEGRPEIGDSAYDDLLARLRELEDRRPEARGLDSPTRSAGPVPSGAFETREHAAPMLSLDSSADEPELRRFHRRVCEALGEADSEYTLQPKLDGLSIELVYLEGAFDRAVTRGNGLVGDVVTRNLLKALPARLREGELPIPSFLSVRGEAMMYRADFESLNASLVEMGRKPFASARNAAAGAVRLLDADAGDGRKLQVFVFDVLWLEGEPELSSDWVAIQALRSWGFRVPPGIRRARSVEDVLSYHGELGRERERLDYEIDGVVVKLDDLQGRGRLGATARHPRWAYAYKFPPRQAATWVRRIELQVGRTGTLTPVAHLVDVELGGVTIRRASLHNREELGRKDIREGDRVLVQRAGDVIPQVVRVLGRDEPYAMPDDCPSCGDALVEDGPRTRCPNRIGCPAQLKGGIAHFGSRNALDIEGLDDKTAELLVDKGLVRSLPDLFDLTAEDIRKLDGFAEKSANNLVGAIEASKSPELDRFLVALGIPEVGTTVARLLATGFGELDEIRAAGPDELEATRGIGSVMGRTISGFFRDPRNIEVVDRLLDRGVAPVGTRLPTFGRIAFTGKLPISRAEAAAMWKAAGGEVSSSVSKKTDFLVAGDRPGSSLAKARNLGVEVIGYPEFRERATLATARTEGSEQEAYRLAEVASGPGDDDAPGEGTVA